MPSTIVIVGASVGGVRTAQALRNAGHTGDLVLLGEEEHVPYDKPPLSKALLAGTSGVEDVGLLTREAADEAGIELRLGVTAEGLDPDAREVLLAGGERLGYDELVVATGAGARPSPWGTPRGVHLLRTLDDSRALRADLVADADSGGHLVVVGSGFIGAEVAATARGLGVEVTMVDPVEVPLSRLLGEQMGRVLGDLHTRQGVTTHFGVGVDDVTGERPELRVTLSDGTVLAASTVVVGIGAAPRTGWLDDVRGLTIDDGLLCDEYGRADGVEHVWALGDVSRWHHPRHGEPRRVEHWTNAGEQARVVAHNITHPEELRTHAPVEFVWTDQYDWKVQIVGDPGGDPTFVGDPATDTRFAALYGDGALTGAVAVNWPKAVLAARRGLPKGLSVQELTETLAAQSG